jgi:hypothetical protein
MYTGEYRAVTLRHSATCCRSARALDGKRFLSTNAPGLPLANCSSPGLCRCKYETLNDRRDDSQPAPRPAARSGFKSLALRLFSGRTDIA